MKTNLLTCILPLLFLVTSCSTTAAPKHKDGDMIKFSFVSNCEMQISDQLIPYGSLVTNPGDVVKEKNIFDGWFTMNNQTYLSKWDFDTFRAYNDTTLYAKFTEQVFYTVNFYNGSELVKTINDVKPNSIIEPIKIEIDSFLYWADIDGNKFDFNCPIVEDTNLYAKLGSAFINLDYKDATHFEPTYKIPVKLNEEYELPHPYKNNATFLGWFDSNDNLFPTKGIYAGTNGTNLTAKFKDGSSGLIYESNGSFNKVKIGTNYEKDIFVPEFFNGLIVKEVPENGFINLTNCDSIEFSLGLTDIGKKAFFNSNINKIVLPDSVIIIGESGFENCISLETVNFPKNLKYLGLRSFFGCRGLTEIHLPSSLLELKGGVFNECRNLKRAYFDRGDSKGNITKPSSSNRADFRNNDVGLVLVVPEEAKNAYIDAYKTQYIWNDNKKIEDYIVSLNDYADDLLIKNDRLLDYKGTTEELVVETNIKEIGPGCFTSSKIKNITLPSSCNVLWGEAFSKCQSINKVTLKTRNSINFKKLSFGGIELNKAFKDGSTVLISYSSNKLSDLSIFSNVNLEVIRGNVTVNFITNTELIISPLTVQEGSKIDCPIEKPSHEGYTFNGWYQTLEDKTEKKWDFENDYVYDNLVLEAKFIKNKDYKVTFDYQNATIKGGDDFIYINNGEILNLPRPYKDDCNFIGWFYNEEQIIDKSIFEFESNITLVARYEQGSSNLSYTLADTSLGNGYSVSKGTFNEASLTVPELHNGLPVIEIGLEAFKGMSTLLNVKLPEGIIQLNQRCFRECTKLTTLVVPYSCKKILAGAFYGNTNMSSLTCLRDKGAGVTTAGNDAVLRNVKVGFVLYVPVNSIDEYKKNDNKWILNTTPAITIKGIGE